MPRKRPRGESSVYQLDSDASIDSMDDFQVESDHNQDSSDDEFVQSQEVSSSDNEVITKRLYKHVASEYSNLLKLKLDLQRQLARPKKKPLKKPKETFSRFSVTSFSKVVNAVSTRREVIESYGFGNLLNFDKCFVPWKFARWIAQQVDYKSGDILIGGKVISLTPESVHQVLGLPLGGLPFPTDISTGKSFLLQKFKKHSIPPVMFFVDKLTKELDSLSDEDIFVCFILAALNTFLCPNASQTPCQKYFGIFSDITNARDFDWSGYILSWLFQHIKTFNRGKASTVKDEGTLGGCLFYLAVMYLDFVDFGPRTVADDIPRIAVWKNNMIQNYSQLDCKGNGCYGLRPKLDFNDTCYAKSLNMLNSRMHSVADDAHFLENLDSASRCKLPDALKHSICNIIQKHILNSGLSIQMDLTAINSLPYKLYLTITKLLQHASSVDSRSKTLVLEIIKAITEFPLDDVDAGPSGVSPEHTANGTPGEDIVRDVSSLSSPNSPRHQPSHTASPVHPTPSLAGSESPTNFASKSPVELSGPDLANHSSTEKLGKNLVPTTSAPSTSSKRFVSPTQSYPPGCAQGAVIRKCKPRIQPDETVTTSSKIAKLRDPLCDLSNLDVDITERRTNHANKISSDDGRQKDVVPLDDDDDHHFVPGGNSPQGRPGSLRTFADKSTPDSDKENFSPQLTQTTAKMVTPNLQSRDRHVRFAPSSSGSKRKASPEVQILAAKTLSQSVRDMTRIGDDMYNKKFCSKPSSAKATPSVDVASPSHSPSSFRDNSQHIPYLSRDSSTGGKLPAHGPRRSVKPVPLFQGEYETDKPRICLTPAELKNYQSICTLATSQFSRDDVVVVGKVRCTFWALGDSLKPDGCVNSFLVSAFCYSLFLKPAGQPDQSKAHYFFPNISAELMKDPDEANQDLLCRAFKRSHRSRPLHHCNNLFFPIHFGNHWSVFIVNIKDRNFVFLDSLHHEDHEYQEIIRDSVVPSFQLHWEKFIKVPMDFDEYKFLYPVVPLQDPDNSVDSGIYAMMFLQHWKSPRTVLLKCFDSSDIPRIRVKVANELLYIPGNTGDIKRVLEFQV